MSKLDGIKPGDRVRVTFEGEVVSADVSGLDVKTDGGPHVNGFVHAEMSAPTFHIEKLAPPLKVGDRVTWDKGVDEFELVAIKGKWGVLYTDSYGCDARLVDFSELRAAQ